LPPAFNPTQFSFSSNLILAIAAGWCIVPVAALTRRRFFGSFFPKNWNAGELF
jgi:hypothetical protein